MEDLDYVGFWARFWASMVDVIILMMIIYPLFYMIYGSAFVEKASDFTLVNNLINYLLPFVAVILLWKSKGATPGKMLIKAIIVDAHTLQAPSTKQLVIRYFGYIASLIPFGLGYFWAGWDKRKQTWHDKLAGTVVVRPKMENRSKSIGSYIAIGFGVFAIAVFGALLTVGVMLQSGMMPDGDLYDAKKLPSSVTVDLVEENILSKEDIVNYYQPQSTFSFTGSGIIFTDETIRYFERDEQGEAIVWDFPLKEIGKLTLDVESYVLGIELITMTLYNEEGEMDFTAVLSPKEEKTQQF